MLAIIKDKSGQDEIEATYNKITIPVIGYLQSSQLSYGPVWIATKSGIAQEGILNENIAYVFINGSGIYVRSILLKEQLGWFACSLKLCVANVGKSQW